MTAATHCPRCTQPIDGHTVAEWKACLSDLHDHDLPLEAHPVTTQELQVYAAGGLAVKAGVHRSEIGTYPLLIFEFSGPQGPIPPIALILDEAHMASVATLVADAATLAIKAAET